MAADSIKDGGPAFAGYRAGETFQRGMSLRDYFAGQALAQIADPHAAYVEQVDRVAQHCYEYADAMLKAREATHAR